MTRMVMHLRKCLESLVLPRLWQSLFQPGEHPRSQPSEARPRLPDSRITSGTLLQFFERQLKSTNSSFLRESIHLSTDPTSSTILENDRTYASTTYPLPSDAEEDLRLSIEHQAFTLLLDRKLTLTYLPTSTPLRILDIGTGPGDWALSTALKYPQSTVIATDLSPLIGSSATDAIPSNLSFQLDDARVLPWTFPPSTFDFVHMRGLAGAFTDSELSTIYTEIFRTLKPGGQVEIADFGALAPGGLGSSRPGSHSGLPETSGSGSFPGPRWGSPENVPSGSSSDRKSTRLNSSHSGESRMPSSA